MPFKPARSRIARAASLLLLLALAACKVELYTRLNEREANEMVAVLLHQGIDAARVSAKDGTSTVTVEKSRLAEATDLLRANMLPRQTFATMGEVFAQQSLVSSPTEERARFIHALSQELSRTISDIDGVLSARIHVVLPRADPLRQEGAPAAASVFIRHDARFAIGDIVPQIKMLVANSIEGLSYDRVSLVLLPIDRPAPVPAAVPAATATDLTMPAAAGGAALVVAVAGVWLWRRIGAQRGALPGSVPKAAPSNVAASVVPAKPRLAA